MSSPEAEAGRTCDNCGVQLVGAWCHGCGQKEMDLRGSFVDLLFEFFRETFEVDGRVPRTLWALVAKPGQLTRAFMEGRRASFTPPFRLYLACSLVWLSLASLQSVAQDWSGEEVAGVELHVSKNGEGPDDVQFNISTGDQDGTEVEVDPETGAVTETTRISYGLDGQPIEPVERPSWDESFETASGYVLHLRTSFMDDDEATAYAAGPAWALVQERLRANWEANQGTHSGTWWLARVVPSSAILTLPWLAGLLWFFHGPRRAGGVVEGLVAALHLNAYGFLAFTVFFASMAGADPFATILQSVVLLSMPVHLFLLMRRVWGHSVLGTLWRWAVLGFVYLLSFFLVIALNIVYGTLLG